MSETLSDFRTRVQNLSRVPVSSVSNAQTDEQIAKAVKEYSRKRPLVRTKEFSASNSSNLYPLTGIVTGWNESYAVQDVLYRVSSGRRPSVDGNSWEVQEDEGVYTLFLQPSLDTDDEVIVSSPPQYFLQYSGPHTLNDTLAECTVRDEDLEALSYLAASYCCIVAANEASDQKDSSFTSDVVDYQTISDKWHKAAGKMKKVWDEHIKGRTGGHSSRGEWDLRSSRGRMLFHGSRRF